MDHRFSPHPGALGVVSDGDDTEVLTLGASATLAPAVCPPSPRITPHHSSDSDSEMSDENPASPTGRSR
jgi:hypothetical protein